MSYQHFDTYRTVDLIIIIDFCLVSLCEKYLEYAGEQEYII